MNTLLLLVLSVVLGEVSGTELRIREADFASLPPECAAEYLPFLKEERQAAGTKVARCDLDGDGAPELLVWTGACGSGGETWSVMTRRDGKWRRAGQIFGTMHFIDRPPHRGLVVETPRGWEYATWTFFELRDGSLCRRLTLDVRYRPAKGSVLRTRPAEIIIGER